VEDDEPRCIQLTASINWSIRCEFFSSCHFDSASGIMLRPWALPVEDLYPPTPDRCYVDGVRSTVLTKAASLYEKKSSIPTERAGTSYHHRKRGGLHALQTQN